MPMFLVINHLNFDFLKFYCIFPCGTVVNTFLNNYICSQVTFGILTVLLKDTCEILSQNLGKFTYGEKQCPVPMEWNPMKSCFFCQNFVIFWDKMVHVVIERYFSLFLKWFEIFLITDSPFKYIQTNMMGDGIFKA